MYKMKVFVIQWYVEACTKSDVVYTNFCKFVSYHKEGRNWFLNKRVVKKSLKRTNILCYDMGLQVNDFGWFRVTLGAFTLLTSRFLKSRHFDPTIYTCAKIAKFQFHETSRFFWLVVRMCDHRLQCMHSCMQRMQYAWGPRISIHISKSARS